MKRINHFVVKLFLIFTVIMPLSQDVTQVQANQVEEKADLVTATVSRPFHYNEHALLTVNVPDNVDIQHIVADVSQLGGSQQLVIDPELLAVTLSVTHDVAPGEYEIPITWWNQADEAFQTQASVTVLPREKAEGELDWDEEIIYFLLTDRFFDGDDQNNNPYDLAYEEADNQRGIYQGGDFQGITEKLAYLEELGVTTIWISPIVANIAYDVSAGSNDGTFYGYHGYWAQDFERLNPHFGTLEDFHALIDSAAERNIKIMVDVVLNHTGYGLHQRDSSLANPPEGYPTEEDRKRFEGMLRESPGMDSLTQELSGLPDFVTEEPDVYQQLVDWQTNWLELSTTPKGNAIASYRVDTVIHVDNQAWQHFRNELTLLDPEFQLIGEVWGASATSSKGYLNSGMMDSVLDFEFKDYARNFINGDIRGVEARLKRRNEAMTSSATAGQFLSSHDEIGFFYTLSGNEGKYKVAVTLQMTAKGQPVIYYGEELGQTGANNWPVYDNRYDLDWDIIEDNDILEHYKKLIAFRREYSEILARGTRAVIRQSPEDKWSIIERDYDGERVYVVINLSEEAHVVNIPVTSQATIIKDYYSGESYEVTQNDSKDTMIEIAMPSVDEGGTMLLTIEAGGIIPDSE